MAWKTVIRSVPPTLAPTDSFEIEVEYVDTLNAARNFRQSLHITAGQVTSTQDLRDLLAAKRQQLIQLDQVKAQILTLINQEL